MTLICAQKFVRVDIWNIAHASRAYYRQKSCQRFPYQYLSIDWLHTLYVLPVTLRSNLRRDRYFIELFRELWSHENMILISHSATYNAPDCCLLTDCSRKQPIQVILPCDEGTLNLHTPLYVKSVVFVDITCKYCQIFSLFFSFQGFHSHLTKITECLTQSVP